MYANKCIAIQFELIVLFVGLLIAPVVIIQFEATTAIVNENDGTVTVNLLRKTGTLSNNITLCIDIAMSLDPDISQCKCRIV